MLKSDIVLIDPTIFRALHSRFSEIGLKQCIGGDGKWFSSSGVQAEFENALFPIVLIGRCMAQNFLQAINNSTSLDSSEEDLDGKASNKMSNRPALCPAFNILTKFAKCQSVSEGWKPDYSSRMAASSALLTLPDKFVLARVDT